MSSADDLRVAIASLSVELQRHVEGVVVEAQRLAIRCGVNEGQAVLAALGHDIARELSDAEMLASAREFSLSVDPVEAATPMLLHGPVGAEILHRRYGIDDEDVLAAAQFHTTGRPNMTALEKLVFVADKIEPGRERSAGDMAVVRALAEAGDLDGAVLAYLDRQMVEYVRLGRALHPLAVATRNHLLLTRHARLPE